jgi:NAD kinase
MVQSLEVQPNDRVHIHVSDHTGLFIRLRERNYFYRSLLDRLEPRVQRTREKE